MDAAVANAAVAPKHMWHQAFWTFLHTITMWMDRDGGRTAAEARAFADGLTVGIPCPECLKEWRECLAECPPPDDCQRGGLFRWGVDLHNRVNARLRRPCVGMDQAYALWGYTSERPDCLR